MKKILVIIIILVVLAAGGFLAVKFFGGGLTGLTGRKSIMDMMEEIRQRTGVTMLVAIHDLTLAAQYCQRIAILHQGRIVADGTPERVLTAEVVSRVYGTPVSVSSHPVDGTPVVLPVRKEWPESESDAGHD